MVSKYSTYLIKQFPALAIRDKSQHKYKIPKLPKKKKKDPKLQIRQLLNNDSLTLIKINPAPISQWME